MRCYESNVCYRKLLQKVCESFPSFLAISCRANEVLIRLEQQIAGLKEKEKTLHNRNSELQHRLIDVEGKIEVTLNGQRSNTDQVSWVQMHWCIELMICIPLLASLPKRRARVIHVCLFVCLSVHARIPKKLLLRLT